MAKRSKGSSAKTSKPKRATKVQTGNVPIPELDIDKIYATAIEEHLSEGEGESSKRRKWKTAKKWWDKKTKGVTDEKKDIAKQIQEIYEANGYVKQSPETIDKYSIEQLKLHLDQLKAGKHSWITRNGVTHV